MQVEHMSTSENSYQGKGLFDLRHMKQFTLKKNLFLETAIIHAL